VIQDEASCERIGGVFLGIAVKCDSADCRGVTPSRRASWGVLKALHRNEAQSN
jgi:hypothetical protein